MSDDRSQTIKEVAGRLFLSEATVHGWIKRDYLHAVEIDQEWRIMDRDLNSFLHKFSTQDHEPGSLGNKIGADKATGKSRTP
ncbi:MAG: helix-turn-helix domain-containing protein [Pseudomonadota bacterium]